MIKLYHKKYPDFGPTFASEKLEELDSIRVNRETLRRWLVVDQQKREWQRKGRKHRQWRQRKEHCGEMVQMDGSHHDWLEGRGPELVLMGYIDDATGRVFARFYEYDATMPEGHLPGSLVGENGEFVEMPWTQGRMSAVVEAGHCYLALGDVRMAARCFDLVGMEGNNYRWQFLAARGMGQTFYSIRRYLQSIQFYEYALRCFDQEFSAHILTDGEKDLIPERMLIIHDQIMDELDEVYREWDEKRYGPDFVLYRDADQMRRSGEFQEAIEIYQKVMEKYAETIYAETSEMHIGLCLIGLSDKALEEKRQRKQGKAKKKKVSRRGGKKKKRKKLGDPKKYIEQAERWLQAFIEKDEAGLYRGEAMKAIADIALERRVEPELAREWYEKTLSWIQERKEFDAELDLYEVPDRASSVTAPPPTRKVVDAWGKASKSYERPGVIINRETSRWYLDDMKRWSHLMLGLMDFIDEEYESAMERFEWYRRLDPVVWSRNRQGRRTAYSRLVMDCKDGNLEGRQQDIKPFTGKKRVAVFLADFYHISEEWGKAEYLYREIEEGRFGRASRKEAAYSRFRRAVCRSQSFDFNGALELLKGFDTGGRFVGTPPEDQALIMLGCLSMQGREEVHKDAWKYFWRAYKKFPKSKEGEKALTSSNGLPPCLSNLRLRALLKAAFKVRYSLFTVDMAASLERRARNFSTCLTFTESSQPGEQMRV